MADYDKIKLDGSKLIQEAVEPIQECVEEVQEAQNKNAKTLDDIIEFQASQVNLSVEIQLELLRIAKKYYKSQKRIEFYTKMYVSQALGQKRKFSKKYTKK